MYLLFCCGWFCFCCWYVDLVFQTTGVSGTDCDDITFELLELYPLEFDPGVSGVKIFKRIDYLSDFDSSILTPYKVRIHEDAIDGLNEVKVTAKSKGGGEFRGTFNIDIENSIVDFETYVKDYDYATKELELEVLNIGDSDIKALTVEIPKQGNIDVKGSNRVVVGDLDSNEFTSADFEATPSDGILRINLIYTDAINVRREVTKDIVFDSSYFTDRIADQKKSPGIVTYLVYAAILAAVIYFIYNKRKKLKAKHNHS